MCRLPIYKCLIHSFEGNLIYGDDSDFGVLQELLNATWSWSFTLYSQYITHILRGFDHFFAFSRNKTNKQPLKCSVTYCNDDNWVFSLYFIHCTWLHSTVIKNRYLMTRFESPFLICPHSGSLTLHNSCCEVLTILQPVCYF